MTFKQFSCRRYRIATIYHHDSRRIPWLLRILHTNPLYRSLAHRNIFDIQVRIAIDGDWCTAVMRYCLVPGSGTCPAMRSSYRRKEPVLPGQATDDHSFEQRGKSPFCEGVFDGNALPYRCVSYTGPSSAVKPKIGQWERMVRKRQGGRGRGYAAEERVLDREIAERTMFLNGTR